MKSPGQIAYEAGAAHIDATHPDRLADGTSLLASWDKVERSDKVYWEIVAYKVIEETQGQHVTRFSDASTFDEICIKCGATDQGGAIKGRCL